MNEDFKLCVDCRHFMHRHELDNTCGKFETGRDVMTGWASYVHVRMARANDGMCGTDAKLFEPIPLSPFVQQVDAICASIGASFRSLFK